MIDHFNLPVSDLHRSTSFYEQVLSSLGISLLIKEFDAAGFGNTTWEFGIVQEIQVIASIHLAFVADSPDQVQAFYKAALLAGGRCNGKPGLRTQYGEGYYAAYLLDPDDHNVEAVFRLKKT